MGKDVIIACDFDSKEKTMEFLDLFKDEKPYVKIGMELFYSEGPSIVREIKERGHRIFLDLKLHDIPNTVKKSMTALSKLGADMINVHAAGTIRMMEAAMEGISTIEGEKPIIIAVTQLTSTDEERMRNELLIEKDLKSVVSQYALNAKTAGLSGVVCSPLESGEVHDKCGKEFVTVTPGIRFSDDSKGDQRRVTTPEMARRLGSDYIVVGRSITGAKDPVEAYRRCVNEFVD